MARSNSSKVAPPAATPNGEHTSVVHKGPINTAPLLDALATSPYELLYPSPELHSAALQLAKFYLDPVAGSLSEAQIARRDEARRSFKRKRKAGEFKDEEEEMEMDRDRKGNNVLRIRQLTVEGFETQQVWEQVSQVAKAVSEEVERLQRGIERTKRKTGGKEEDFNDGENTEASEDEVFTNSDSDMSDIEEVDSYQNGGILSEELDEDEDEEMESDNDEDEDSESEKNGGRERFVQDKFGLNDGFFSIDEFNKRTEALEELDARGEPEAPSDEEDIDWDINPATLSLGTKGRRRKDVDESDEDEEDDDDEEGPTFGNMDLDAPEGASEEGSDDEHHEEGDDGENAESLMYANFFDPPPNASTNLQKGKKKAKAKPSPTNGVNHDDFENDIQRTIRKLQFDEFEEESDSGLPINASTHEKRRAALLAQIKELEAENVAKKSWTLMGEARAHDRPIDAALNEDLEFERTGKPLPIVTKETSEAIEELIKRRILASEYDEVRKRRPEDVYGTLNKSSRKDAKSDENLDTPRRRGLAEVYEEEHLRKTDAAYVDEKSEKRNKEHAEIETLWNDISSKLDSLASWNYKPKPPEISVTVRTDAPAISLEDARPGGAGGEIGTMNQLAPQEVFAPSDVKETGKIVTKGGTILDRTELSRDQRKRMRQREKERTKKRSIGLKVKDTGKPKDTQSTVVTDLKKGGVRVIGKKGELRDVDGNEVTEESRKGGSSLRL